MMEENVTEEDFRDIDMGKFVEEYSEAGLWEKLRDNVTAIGLTLIYKAM